MAKVMQSVWVSNHILVLTPAPCLELSTLKVRMQTGPVPIARDRSERAL